jgi:hypothetical protein
MRRVDRLMEINQDLASEIGRLNGVIRALTGPIGLQRESHVMLWRQGRTRNLERILTVVADGDQ